MPTLKPLHVVCDSEGCPWRATDSLYDQNSLFCGNFCPMHGLARFRQLEAAERRDSYRSIPPQPQGEL